MNWTAQVRFQQPWPSSFAATQKLIQPLLSASELGYIRNQRSLKRCFEFALGRALAKLVIIDIAGVAVTDIIISLPNKQAPTLMVQHDKRWSLSIAHSQGAIQVAVSNQADLGVDIQRVDNERNLSAFINMYPALRDIQKADFYSRWVCLEAYAKLKQVNLIDLLQCAFDPPSQVRFSTYGDSDFWSAIATNSPEKIEILNGRTMLPIGLQNMLRPISKA